MDPSNAFYAPGREKYVQALVHRPFTRDQLLTFPEKLLHAVVAAILLVPCSLVTIVFVALRMLVRKLKGLPIYAGFHDTMMTLSEEKHHETLKIRVSSTARFIGTLRFGTWLSGMAHDHLAVHFLTADTFLLGGVLSLVRAANFSRLPRRTIGPFAYVANRTQICDAVVENSSFDQIVILGAGFDSRAYRLKNPASRVFFEVDISGTQEEKIRIVEANKASFQGNVVFCQVDFTCDNFIERLQANGLDLSRKAVFIIEGLTYYLERPVVEKLFKDVSRAAKGSLLVVDYFEDVWSDEEAQRVASERKGGPVLARVLRRAGEPIKFGFKHNESPAVFEKLGYKLLFNAGQRELSRLYLTRVQSGKVEDVVPEVGHVCIYEVA